MFRKLCQRLIGIAVGALLIGCASRGMKADLIQGLITDGRTAERDLRPAAATSLPAVNKEPAVSRDAPDAIHFSFHAFGDSGWAQSHVSRPRYSRGFQKAYGRFDRDRSLLGDLNYINWETSVGKVCDAFWSKPSDSSYAFLTRPEELSDAIRLGFQLVGLANNHSFDCLRSPEGAGPLQTYGHIEAIRHRFNSSAQAPQVLFSGVFARADQEPATGFLRSRAGHAIPVTFLSAYVGGDPEHCRHIVCEEGLEQYHSRFSGQRGLRVLALHSWDPRSHARLKAMLQSWLQQGLIDVALGSGPHIAEEVRVIQTPRGAGVLATSLGNFIHPSLSKQPHNIVLRTSWRLQPASGMPQLLRAEHTLVRCDAQDCRRGPTTTLWSAPTL